MAEVNPYVNYNGNCEDAFNFYKSVFGGEFMGGIMRWGDNQECGEMSDADKNQVMHVSLPIGNSILMGSDTPASMGGATYGNAYTVAIGSTDIEETRRIFDGLSEGANVTMALEKTFWGATFGMLTDRYGIQWLINCDESRSQA